MKKLLAFTVLSACGSQAALKVDADFRPSPDRQSFQYSNIANEFVPANDPKIEANRLAVLDGLIAVNQMCPDGYTITDRQFVVTLNIPPIAGRLDYEGRCNTDK